MKRLNVILSQAPGKHPAKRALEESVAAALLVEPGIDLSIIPNIYDLGPDHTGRLFLEGISGDVIVLYSDGIRSVSLFENAKASTLDVTGLQTQWTSVGGRRAEYAEEGATALLAWNDANLHYALVGELGMDELRSIAAQIEK